MKNISDLYSEDVEQQLLGSIFNDPSTVDVVKNVLKPEHLFKPANQTIYENILNLSRANKTIDIVSVSELLKFKGVLSDVGGRRYINDLALNYISSANMQNIIKTILNYYKLRTLYTISKEVETDLDNKVDINKVLEKLKLTSEDLLGLGVDTNLRTMNSAVVQIMEEVEQLLNSNDKILGLPTGFSAIDKRMQGLRQGLLYILAARPSVGKSALAFQIAENVAKNKVVLYHSIEMRVEDLTRRNLLGKAKINMEILSNTNQSVDDILDKLAAVTPELSDNLLIDDTPVVTLHTIEKNIISLKKTKGRCDLLVIDYAQLMGSVDKTIKDPYQIHTANSIGLKRLAKKYNIPILLLCQLSRQVETRQDKIPLLSDLKDTGSYEQDADVVMFIHRPELYEDNPALKGKANIIIAKNREGRIGTVNLLFNGSSTRFLEDKSDKFI